MIPVTAFYAALLALIYVRLGIRVVRARRAARVSLGTGGDPALIAAVRAHGNCAEYAPFASLLMACAELNGAHWSVLHALGVAFVVGRVLHPLGLSKTPEDFRPRIWGMRLTLYGLIVAAFLNIVLAAWTAIPQ